MAASYPGTIKTFSTKASGEAIASSHINDLQNEMVAVETQLGVNAGTWQDWTPNYTQYTTMTFTSITTNFARYCKVGKLCFIELSAYGTLGGTINDSIDFSPPIAGTHEIFMPAGWAQPYTDVLSSGVMRSNSAGTVFRVYKADVAQYQVGNTVKIVVSGVYEVA